MSVYPIRKGGETTMTSAKTAKPLYDKMHDLFSGKAMLLLRCANLAYIILIWTAFLIFIIIEHKTPSQGMGDLNFILFYLFYIAVGIAATVFLALRFFVYGKLSTHAKLRTVSQISKAKSRGCIISAIVLELLTLIPMLIHAIRRIDELSRYHHTLFGILSDPEVLCALLLCGTVIRSVLHIILYMHFFRLSAFGNTETRQSIIPSVLLVILTITHILSPLLLIKNSSKDVFIILPYFLLTAFYCIFERIFVIKYISLLINSVKN